MIRCRVALCVISGRHVEFVKEHIKLDTELRQLLNANMSCLGSLWDSEYGGVFLCTVGAQAFSLMTAINMLLAMKTSHRLCWFWLQLQYICSQVIAVAIMFSKKVIIQSVNAALSRRWSHLLAFTDCCSIHIPNTRILLVIEQDRLYGHSCRRITELSISYMRCI